MSIDLDRVGNPQHHGKPDHFTEHDERCFDLCHGRIGEPEQKATALRLRPGLSGPAYEAARKLMHEDFLTSDEDGKGTRRMTE